MNTTPSKFWAYIAVIVGVLLMLAGLAALIGYFGLPIFLPIKDVLSYNLGQIAGIFLGLGCGLLAVYHGSSSISKRKSSTLKLPSFYIFWIILALVLGLGSLVINIDIAAEFLFPPLFVLGAALSTFAVLAWAYHKMGFPITWRQASLAFVCGSTLAIFVAIVLESTLPYLAYLLLEPFWYLAEGFADLAWGAPGFIERLFASPLIFVFLAVTAVEAPIPEEFAKALGIPMFGTGGLLVLAKRRGLLTSVGDGIAKLRDAGLWMSDDIARLLQAQAGESVDSAPLQAMQDQGLKRKSQAADE